MPYVKKMQKVSNAVEDRGAITFFMFYDRCLFKEGNRMFYIKNWSRNHLWHKIQWKIHLLYSSPVKDFQ